MSDLKYDWLDSIGDLGIGNIQSNIDENTPVAHSYGPLEGLAKDWEDFQYLNKVSKERSLTFSDFMARLGQAGMILDTPRRELWRTSRSIINPFLEKLGVDHPEKYEDFQSASFDVADKLQNFAEKEAPGIFKPDDVNVQNPGIIDWIKMIGKGLPSAIPIAAGTVADIYTDPAGYFNVKTKFNPLNEPTLMGLERAAKDSFDPFFASGEARKGIGVPLSKSRLAKVTNENIPEAAKIYLHDRMSGLVDQLASKRELAQRELSTNPVALETVMTEIDAQEEALRSALRGAFAKENEESYLPILEQARKDVGSLGNVKVPLMKSYRKEIPELAEIITKPGRLQDENLKQYVPWDYTEIQTPHIARQQALIEHLANQQRVGVHANLPGIGSMPIPLVTDMTGKMIQGAMDVKDKLKGAWEKWIGVGGPDFDSSIRNTLLKDIQADNPLYDVIPRLNRSIKELSPDAPLDKIRVGDVELLLRQKQGMPGGLRGNRELKKFFNNYAKVNKLTAPQMEARFSPIYDFLGKLSEMDSANYNPGKITTTLSPSDIYGKVGAKELLRKASERESKQPWYRQPIDLAEQATWVNPDPFAPPLDEKEALQELHNMFNQASNHKKNAFLRRNLRYYTDAQTLLDKGFDPQLVAKAAEYVSKNPVKQAVFDVGQMLDAAVKKEIEHLTPVVRQAQQLNQNPIQAIKTILDTQMRNPDSAISVLAERYAAALKWNPPVWWESGDATARLKGIRERMYQMNSLYHQYNGFLDQWMNSKSGKDMLEFLFAATQRDKGWVNNIWQVRTKQPDGMNATLEELSRNSTLTPEAVEVSIMSKIRDKKIKQIAEPQVKAFANLLVSAAHNEREQLMETLNNFVAQWDEVKQMNHTFQHSKAKMQALAGITPTLLHEIDQAYTIPTLDELHFAEKTGFDFGKMPADKKSEFWMRTYERGQNALRMIFKNLGMDPEVVDLLDKNYAGYAYDKKIAEKEAKNRVFGVLQDAFVRNAANVNPNFDITQNLDVARAMSPAFGKAYGYKGTNELGKRRIAEGINEMAAALGYEPNSPLGQQKAMDALSHIAQWWEKEMQIVVQADNIAGIPTHRLEGYFPLILDGSLSDKRKAFDAWTILHNKNLNRSPANVAFASPMLNKPYANTMARDFPDLDSFEAFINDVATGRVSGLEENKVGPLKLAPVTDLMHAYQQRIYNHKVGVRTANFLRQLQIDAPHLIRDIRTVNNELGTWINDILASANMQADTTTLTGVGSIMPTELPNEVIAATPAEMQQGFVPNAESLISTPSARTPTQLPTKNTMWLREDFAQFLDRYLPYNWDWEITHSPADGLMAFASSLHHKINGMNVAYNGFGFAKQLLSLALIGGVDMGKFMQNMFKYGMDYEKNPFFHEAAELGAVPFAGITHNLSIRDIANRNMGRLGTNVNEPVKSGLMSSWFPNQNTVVMGREMDPGKLLGWLWEGREPELTRAFTWDFMDKNLRLTLYEQGLELGMPKFEAAKFARNAMVDYQVNWLNAKARSLMNLMVIFPGWWMGNLALHTPNMLTNPRLYVVMNHIQDLVNQYTTGESMEENPYGLQKAMALPQLPGSLSKDPLYWDLQLPWSSQQMVANQMIEAMTTNPYVPSSDLDFLTRLSNSYSALMKYFVNRFGTVPVQLIKSGYEAGRHSFDPEYVPSYLRDGQGFSDGFWNTLKENFWGISPVVTGTLESAAQVPNAISGEPVDTTPFWKMLIDAGIGGSLKKLTPDRRVDEL